MTENTLNNVTSCFDWYEINDNNKIFCERILFFIYMYFSLIKLSLNIVPDTTSKLISLVSSVRLNVKYTVLLFQYTHSDIIFLLRAITYHNLFKQKTITWRQTMGSRIIATGHHVSY